MKFAKGDRVRMVKHADWKSDAIGTVAGPPRKRKVADGSSQWDYWIEFDTPQSDLTDEMHGDHDRVYKSSTVLEQYLRPLIDTDDVPQ